MPSHQHVDTHLTERLCQAGRTGQGSTCPALRYRNEVMVSDQKTKVIRSAVVERTARERDLAIVDAPIHDGTSRGG